MTLKPRTTIREDFLWRIFPGGTQRTVVRGATGLSVNVCVGQRLPKMLLHSPEGKNETKLRKSLSLSIILKK